MIKGSWYNRVKLAMMRVFLCTSLTHTILAAPETSFFKDHARGWFWYEDLYIDTLEEPKKDEKETTEQLTPRAKPKTATERLNAVKEHLAELKAKAILEPTSDNVKA